MGASEHLTGADAILEESAEDLYENAPCGYLSTRPDGVIVRLNATFLRWTGYRRDELVGVKRFQDLLTAGGRIYHETHFAPLLRMQGMVREIALDIVRADGGRLPVLVNSVLKTDADGAPWLVRTTVFDATERKLYERELLAARNRERIARERIERLQRLTAAIAAAPDADAIAAVVTNGLVAAFEGPSAGVAVIDGESGALRVVARHGDSVPDESRDSPSEPEFDDGEGRDHGALVRLPLGRAPAREGFLWLAFDDARRFEPDERAFLLACAEQCALALERARLHEQQRDVALMLQRSLVAGDPPADERFEVATLRDDRLRRSRARHGRRVLRVGGASAAAPARARPQAGAVHGGALAAARRHGAGSPTRSGSVHPRRRVRLPLLHRRVGRAS